MVLITKWSSIVEERGYIALVHCSTELFGYLGKVGVVGAGKHFALIMFWPEVLPGVHI